jgi:hypothetical protein
VRKSGNILQRIETTLKNQIIYRYERKRNDDTDFDSIDNFVAVKIFTENSQISLASV